MSSEILVVGSESGNVLFRCFRCYAAVVWNSKLETFNTWKILILHFFSLSAVVRLQILKGVRRDVYQVHQIILRGHVYHHCANSRSRSSVEII